MQRELGQPLEEVAKWVSSVGGDVVGALLGIEEGLEEPEWCGCSWGRGNWGRRRGRSKRGLR